MLPPGQPTEGWRFWPPRSGSPGVIERSETEICSMSHTWLPAAWTINEPLLTVKLTNHWILFLEVTLNYSLVSKPHPVSIACSTKIQFFIRAWEEPGTRLFNYGSSQCIIFLLLSRLAFNPTYSATLHSLANTHRLTCKSQSLNTSSNCLHHQN